MLRLYAGSDPFLHTWDERYHALVAKHLVEHPLTPTLYDRPVLPYDYRDWRHNHVWLHKPPLALWMMAASMRALGVDPIAMRLPSLVLSAIAIFFTYVIGVHLYGRRAGLLAAAFHAIHGYLLQFPAGRVAVDHVDNALLFFVELGVFLAVLQAQAARLRAAAPATSATPATPEPGESARPAATWAWWAWLPAIGLAAGLAVLAKWLVGLLVLPVWLALVLQSRAADRASRYGRTTAGEGAGAAALPPPYGSAASANRRGPAWAARIVGGLLVIGVVAAAVAAPWQLYIRHTFPLESRWESAYNLYHLFVPIEGLGGSPLYHLLRMPRFFGELIFLPVAWFLVVNTRTLLRRQIPAGLPVAVWLLLPYIAFSLAATKLGGYVMVAAPALFLVQAAFWIQLWDWRPSAVPAARRPLPPRLLQGLRWAALALLILGPLHYTLERLKLRPTYDRDPAWTRALRQLPAVVGPGQGQVVLFHLDRPLEAMFYTAYVAYEPLPTVPQARRLLDAGYRVVILDAANLPTPLRALPGIELRAQAIPASPLDDGTGFRPPRGDGSDSPLAGTVDPP